MKPATKLVVRVPRWFTLRELRLALGSLRCVIRGHAYGGLLMERGRLFHRCAECGAPDRDLEQLFFAEHADRRRRERRVEHRDVEMALMIRHVDVRAILAQWNEKNTDVTRRENAPNIQSANFCSRGIPAPRRLCRSALSRSYPDISLEERAIAEAPKLVLAPSPSTLFQE